MNPQLKALYDDTILAQLAPRYGVRPEEVTSLGGFESFVHAYARDGREYVLKITHTRARSEATLMAELAWLNHLAEQGVPVARSVPSGAGRLVERLPGREGEFLAIAYEKAPGGPVRFEDISPELSRKWGRLMGRMHALSRNYQPSDPSWRRPHWREMLSTAFSELPTAEHAWYFERLDALLSRLQALPCSSEGYGLVHGDLHFGNFFWNGETLTAFDFDDCHHTWYANDIAITLYYVVQMARRQQKDPAEFASAFLVDFLAGYGEEAAFDPAWLALLPDFLKLRRMVLYGVLYQAFEGQAMPELEQQILARMTQGIREDTPLVELDFAALHPLLTGSNA